VCPKPLSRRLWRWSEARIGWDGCCLKSWSDGNAYQDGSVAELLSPESIWALVRARIEGNPEGTVVFCGTPPLLTGELKFGARFEATLTDGREGHELRCAYSVEIVPDLD
jgi:hypothetical protein